MIEQSPPNSPSIERAVLSAMLFDVECIETAAELITEQSFYRPAHALLFRTMVSMYNAGVEVDQLTLAEELAKQGKLEYIGGEFTLAGLAGDPVAGVNIKAHCTALKECENQRSLSVLAKMIEDAVHSRKSPTDIVQMASRHIETIATAADTDEFYGMAQATQEAFAEIELRAASTTGVTGIPSGMPSLDRWLAGWQNGDYIVLAGQTGDGKTVLGMNEFGLYAAECGHGVGCFTMEMNRRQLAMRMISKKAEFDTFHATYNKPTPTDWERITRACSGLSTLPIVIDERRGLNITELMLRAKRMKKNHAAELLVIDYIQLMSGSGTKRESSRQAEIENISRNLKRMAGELEVPVIALSQFKRISGASEKRRPVPSDLRDSGSLEQDADIIILISKMENVPKTDMEAYQRNHGDDVVQNPDRYREIIIAKGRNDGTHIMLAQFEGKYLRFREMARR
jgi:replicative DNA helicase